MTLVSSIHVLIKVNSWLYFQSNRRSIALTSRGDSVTRLMRKPDTTMQPYDDLLLSIHVQLIRHIANVIPYAWNWLLYKLLMYLDRFVYNSHTWIHFVKGLSSTSKWTWFVLSQPQKLDRKDEEIFTYSPLVCEKHFSRHL